MRALSLLASGACGYIQEPICGSNVYYAISANAAAGLTYKRLFKSRQFVLIFQFDQLTIASRTRIKQINNGECVIEYNF